MKKRFRQKKTIWICLKYQGIAIVLRRSKIFNRHLSHPSFLKFLHRIDFYDLEMDWFENLLKHEDDCVSAIRLDSSIAIWWWSSRLPTFCMKEALTPEIARFLNQVQIPSPMNGTMIWRAEWMKFISELPQLLEFCCRNRSPEADPASRWQRSLPIGRKHSQRFLQYQRFAISHPHGRKLQISGNVHEWGQRCAACKRSFS